MNNENTIRTIDLAIGYNKGKNVKVVLDNLNIELSGGEFICLLGANGSGKSTLIRTIAGFQAPLGGKVIIDGRKIESFSRQTLAQRISVVLTDRVAASNLNVFDLVSLGRYPFTNWLVNLTKEDKQAINNAIKQTGISDLLDSKIFELSDGQIQKCMIARALAQDGPIMILDEPTTHLDLNNRVEIMRLLRELAHNQSKTILVATHELDLALQMADSFLLISRNGIQKGIPEDLILSGVLDEVFQMKGYDLRSGRAVFSPTRKLSIAIEGEGYSKLWTKNALERNGFEVKEHSVNLTLKVNTAGENSCEWSILHSQVLHEFYTVKDLIEFLVLQDSGMDS